VLAILATLVFTSCLERTNPFDPINSGDARILSVRDQLLPGLKARAAGAAIYDALLDKYDTSFRSDSAANALIIGNNEDSKNRNSVIDSENAAFTVANANAPVDSLQLLRTYAMLDFLNPYGYADLEENQQELRARTANLALYMSQANVDNAPANIYPPAFSDSVLARFVLDTAAFADMRTRIDQGNHMVNNYNPGIQGYNSLKLDSNRRIEKYNADIIYRKSVGNHPVFTRADSLDAGTKGAKPGDILLIGAGVYTVDLRFNASGTIGKPIQVRGYPGGLTVLRAPAGGNSAMTLSNQASIEFEDIDFRGGVQIVSGCTGIVFRRCVFDSGAIAGISVVNSGVEIKDSRMLRNAIGASIRGTIQGDTTHATEVDLTNVLIAANSQEGVALVDAKGTFARCTIADNRGDGLNLKIGVPGLEIKNSIISGNGSVGVYRIRNTEMKNQPRIEQCDVWGNGGGDWSLAGLDSAAMDEMKQYDRAIPPAFIDAAQLDYRLQPGSALAELENLAIPVVIGYRP
jgi:hypothetical protein